MNRRRRLRNILCGMVVVGLVMGFVFYLLFPGFSRSLMADLRYASRAELLDQYAFLEYYADHYALLHDNDEDGLYELPQTGDHPEWSEFDKGVLLYHRGEFEGAVERFEAAIENTGESEKRLFWLAAAHLRVGEESNCLCRLSPSPGGGTDLLHLEDGTKVCSLPIQTFHAPDGGSARALSIFTKLLDEYDEESALYRWLLNFCAMTNGIWPEDVPEKYQIDSVFIDTFYGGRAEENRQMEGLIRFKDAAQRFGVALLDAGKGVAIEDFDGDGYLDIVTGGTYSKLKYFRNRGGERFEDQTVEAGLGGIAQCYIITAADYDNDGWLDLLVSRPFTHPLLMRNTGGGSFEDVTVAAGVLDRLPTRKEAEYTCVSAWGDVNRDGLLDLFLAQFGQKLPMAGGLLGRKPAASRLLINEGERFRDATVEYGLEKIVDDAVFIGACFGDYDGDGWTDLYLSSFTRNRSLLLRNQAGGRFSATGLIRNRDPGFMVAFVDINHDGRLDLFQGTQAPARTTAANAIVSQSPERLTNKIFLQEDGGFVAHPEFFSDGVHLSTMGASYGDINNDGAWDFYLGTGNPEGWNMIPNLMYLGSVEGGLCTGKMMNISNLYGLGTVQKGHGIVFFDADNDGDQDIYSSLGGMWPGDVWPNQLLINSGDLAARNAWVRLRLLGRQTNRYGIGCMIRCCAASASGEEIVRWYHMDNKTGFGSSPYIAHMGLLDAAGLESVEVYWPGSDQIKKYEGLALRAMHTLAEEAGEPRMEFGEGGGGN